MIKVCTAQTCSAFFIPLEKYPGTTAEILTAFITFRLAARDKHLEFVMMLSVTLSHPGYSDLVHPLC
jgi:hypothetical protein